MIKLSAISKVFVTEDIETTAINALDLHIEDGQFVAIMGPSGCGKSTLLNIIGLMDSPRSGSYLFNGQEIASYNEKQLSRLRKSNIGFVFQSFNLVAELSVKDNIELPLIYNKVPSGERRQRVEAVMQKLNIAHRANHMPQQLSGGQQQRVAVARALVAKPRVILADEPTGNLDSVNGAEVMDLLLQLNKEGTTIVMVTHSQKDAQYADRVIHLLDGKVQEQTLNEQVEKSATGDKVPAKTVAIAETEAERI